MTPSTRTIELVHGPADGLTVWCPDDMGVLLVKDPIHPDRDVAVYHVVVIGEAAPVVAMFSHFQAGRPRELL